MNTLGQRIRDRRKAAGMTQEALAKQCGVSRAAVAQWEGGVTKPSLDHLQRVAEALGVWLSWLTAGGAARPSYQDHFAIVQLQQHPIPVIDYKRARSWDRVSQTYAAEDTEYIATDLNVGPQAFALVITGESMLPEFRDGDKIIVDPEVIPQPGDFVIAKLDDDLEATFKKYRPRGVDDTGQPVIELVPLNDDWPTVTITADNPGRIIGTMVEHRRYRRKRNKG